MLIKEELLGVGITNASEDKILEYIFSSLSKKDDPYYIVTPNPEILVTATRDKQFREILNQAQISLPDGVGVLMAARILRKNITSRVTGTDLLQNICKQSVRKAVTVGFLGGRDGVAEEASECLRKTYPDLRVGFAGEEWEDGKTVDILFVAYGFPKQERWMAEHVGKIDVRIMMGVGGAFDYISGRVPRAPEAIRRLGFEWLYRLILQPWRWKRQLALVRFMGLVIREKQNTG